MHEWIARTARANGDRLAVIAPDRPLTYAELQAGAADLAARLRAAGVRRNEPVALVARPSSTMLVGMLGIMRAGGAYVPLDPAYPPGLVRHVLDDTGAAVMVSQAALADRLADFGPRIVTIEGDGEAAWVPEAEIGAQPDDLAYILYTSGTTGRPKGVPITHRNLVHATEARLRVYGEAPDRFLLLSSFTFDSSVAGIFWTLATGGTLVVPRHRLEQDLDALLALFRECRVTHTLCLPTLHDLILRHAAPADLASLRTVIVAGEACPGALVRTHHQALPNVRLCNEYGPTEATVWSTAQLLAPADATDPVPIGRPIPRMRAFVLDQARRPVPAGVPGELWLAGAGLTAGYRNLEALTAERFATLDVLGFPERAYRTGDLAAWRPDGTLVFLGRADQQLKLRGHRIEPAGIAAVLREHGDVLDATVAVRGKPGRLVAYVVPATGRDVDTGDLKGHLRAVLPDALVPESFVELESLPRTWSGKVDEKALPEPSSAHPGSEPTAPQSEIEATLCGIWCEVLGIPRVGIHENYFALGGDSIMSIQIVSRVRQAGLRIDPRHVLQRPTIAELAQTIDQAIERTSDRAPGSAADREPVAGEVPLSPIQAWFLGRDLGAPHHWNQSALFEVPADFDAERLGRALACLLADHDQLRARFTTDRHGQWRQIVAPPGAVAVPLDVVELGVAEGPGHDAELEPHLRAAQAGFDLGAAPLVRALLVRRGAAQPGLLLLAIHHLVVDAVSWGILIADLEEAYAQAAMRLQPRLPVRTASFRSFVQALEQEMAAMPRGVAVEPWRRVLAADAGDLPCDGAPVSPPVEADARRFRQVLPAELTDALLTRAGERHQTRPEELLLAALTLAVGRSGDRASLRLMREGHGREGDLDLSRTVGWLTAMTPLALSLPAIKDAAVVIQSVKETVRATPRPGQAFSFWRWGGGDPESARSLARAGEPLLLFNFLGRQAQTGGVLRRVAGAEATARSPDNARSHLLEINVQVVDGRLVADWIHVEPVHERDTIERWAGDFARELDRLVAHCLAAVPAAATAAAFPEAGLDDDDLGRLMARLAGR
jgi:amino acid adenylation domain-containing protein/non-ribosomal peptide synthase protein (TIGR01720 family)